MRKLALISLFACLGLISITTTGCVYRSGIVQGNDLDVRAVNRLEKGMTRDQVRGLLGAPLVQDRFHPNRWDYVFYTKNIPNATTSKKVTVLFDNAGLVSNIEKTGIE